MRNLAAWRAGLVLGLAAALEVLCRSGAIAHTVMIPPSAMAAELGRLALSGKLAEHVAGTLASVAAALTLAVTTGFLAGIAIHRLPRLRRALDPLFGTYYAVPFFVFYPVMVAIFGLSQLPVVAIGYLFAVVAMIVNTLTGIDRIPRVLTKVAVAHRLTWADATFRVKLPAAAPNLFVGLKLAVAYSFIGVIASEFIMATSGLGYAIAYAYNNFDNRTMYALMLFVLALVSAVNMALYVWERRMARRRGRG